MAAQQTIETTAVTIKPGAPGTRTVLDAEALLRAEIAQLKAEIAQRKEAQKRKVYCEVAVKSKWMSLKGLGKWPITLPKEWWYLILDDLADDIRTFLQEHDSELKNKGE